MNILFISYSFGDDSPVGVGALRIANAMVEAGCFVYVITSTTYLSNNPQLVIEVVSNIPRLPSRYSFVIGNALQREVNYISWEIKAKRCVGRIMQDKTIHGIYTRSTPICVCPVGIYGKNTFRVPLIMHFTDPLPAPEGWANNHLYRKRMIKQMKEYVCCADFISLGNEKMLQYQEEVLSINFSKKSFVSPDPSSQLFTFLQEKESKDRIVLLYLGNIYGNRNPDELFSAIKRFDNPNLRVIIYGKSFSPAPSFVEFRKRTNDVLSAMKESDYLLDLDGDDERPVFISSKLKDYLSVNRPILSISPINSPTRELLNNIKTAVVSSNDCDSIYNALNVLMHKNFPNNVYQERNDLLNQFKANTIVKDILLHFNMCYHN